MNRTKRRYAWLMLVALAIACAPSFSAAAEEKGCGHNVILAWDDTGDFGPQTPNTKTAGWQEALDYCVANARDLYVKGGWGGRKPIYNVSDTIRIPATQDFRIDGGIYVLNWTGPPDDPAKDLMVIDSTMNGEYHFGIFVYGGAGAALRIRPEKPVPIDGFAVVIETEIKSQGIADPSPFKAGERKAGTGLVFDGTLAPIVSSRFDLVGGILNFKTCVEARGTFVQNHFNCLHLHTNADNSVLFALGPESRQNVIACDIGVDQGAGGVKGLVIAGSNNVLQIMTRGGFLRANDAILEPSASGNRIDLIHGKAAFDPDEFITDKAAIPSNRLTGVGPSIPIRTVKATPGAYTYTQRLYPATVRLVGGAITALKLVRGATSVDYADSVRADILLDVGDQLQVNSTVAPELQVIPRATGP